ncbi:hypothetical protein LR48_Vigan04g126100 [Vigna angularis]|uniref:Uncharacterized protein n=1 Tax=Phaseolus angularis TaxID=3914 RepID=A0A0L9UEA3_PHAAN|nr:hypothetical protein LR48_Vigan04g126100 [Vigna angularis]
MVVRARVSRDGGRGGSATRKVAIWGPFLLQMVREKLGGLREKMQWQHSDDDGELGSLAQQKREDALVVTALRRRGCEG